jgi:hypothetical protein
LAVESETAVNLRIHSLGARHCGVPELVDFTVLAGHRKFSCALVTKWFEANIVTFKDRNLRECHLFSLVGQAVQFANETVCKKDEISNGALITLNPEVLGCI